MDSGRTYTITFGEVAENGPSMEKLGKKAEEGFTVQELKDARDRFREAGYKAYYLDLTRYCPAEYDPPETGILYVRNGVQIGDCDHEQLYQEQEDLEYDTRKINRGRVTNSNARHNICFADFEQESDVENGKGTVVSFESLPCLSSVRENLHKFLGPKAYMLLAEGNKYYQTNKCGIGYHGDAERRLVVAIRLGSPMDLSYIWFIQSNPVGFRFKVKIDPGDLYVMSDKAVGYDWLKRKIVTIRHAAGCKKYTKIPDH